MTLKRDCDLCHFFIMRSQSKERVSNKDMDRREDFTSTMNDEGFHRLIIEDSDEHFKGKYSMLILKKSRDIFMSK